MLYIIPLTFALFVALVYKSLREHRRSFSESKHVTSDELSSKVTCGVLSRVYFPDNFILQFLLTDFRKGLKSSAMYDTEWNYTLAEYAQDSADKCDLDFTFDKGCEANHLHSFGSYYDHHITMNDFLIQYFNDTEYYNPSNGTCQKEGKCQYFNTIAQDTLSGFGCASSQCKVLKSKDAGDMANIHRIVCYFSNRNNLQHVPSEAGVPYSSTGDVCSKCNSLMPHIKSACYEGLCEEYCDRHSCVTTTK